MIASQHPEELARLLEAEADGLVYDDGRSFVIALGASAPAAPGPMAGALN